MKVATKGKKKLPIRSTSARKKAGFTGDELDAMKDRIEEMKAETRRGSSAAKEDGEAAVLAKLGALPQPDRMIGERLHAIVKTVAPSLTPKTWYGMPAYA